MPNTEARRPAETNCAWRAPPGLPEADRLRQFVEVGAYADAAILLFRNWLPDCGFKLVMQPPFSGGAPARAFASAWRRGVAQTAAHGAPTPAAALLRAGRCELMKLRDSDALASCARCGGLGWFITVSGSLEICANPEHAAR
jgi:hypothetical protein